MDLVVDANVLIAAIIKESTSYTLLFREDLHLYTAEYILTEIEEHKEEILKKTKKTEEDFYKLIETLKRRINLVPLEELIPHVNKAEEICPDPDDVVYFALALKLNCAVWSNDKDLKKQNKIKIYHTHDLINIIQPS